MVNETGMIAVGRHGGKRPGAGRPKLPLVQRRIGYGTRLAPDIIAFLQTRDNASDWLDATIREKAEFREFQKVSEKVGGI